MSRRIAFLLFEEFQLLDAAGPISAFEIAERYQPGSYELRVIARSRGAVTSSSGASMNAAGLPSPASVDTLVIAGGSGTRAASRDATLVNFVARCGTRAREPSSPSRRRTAPPLPATRRSGRRSRRG